MNPFGRGTPVGAFLVAAEHWLRALCLPMCCLLHTADRRASGRDLARRIGWFSCQAATYADPNYYAGAIAELAIAAQGEPWRPWHSTTPSACTRPARSCKSATSPASGGVTCLASAVRGTDQISTGRRAARTE